MSEQTADCSKINSRNDYAVCAIAMVRGRADVIWETSPTSYENRRRFGLDGGTQLRTKELNGRRNAGRSFTIGAARNAWQRSLPVITPFAPPVIDSLMTQSRAWRSPRLAPYLFVHRTSRSTRILINDSPSLCAIGRLSKLNGRRQKSRSHDLWVFPANHRTFSATAGTRE